MNALKEQGYMTKSYVETEIQSHFEVGNLTHEGLAKTWDFNRETYTAVPGGVKDRPLARLDGITTAEENGRLVYYVQYTLVQPDYLVLSNQEWQVLAEQVARGDFANLQELGSYTVCFTYENDEPVFLSHTELPSAALSSEEIWLRDHEKLDYAPWAQEMTEEYIAVLQKFEIEDSRLSDRPGDVSQWPRYYSAFVDYFSAANADLRYLDADTIWTKDLSEDQQSLIVTMTRADVVLTLSYLLQTSQITEVSTRRNAVLQSVTGDSITAEHITLLNASLEEDLQTLKALNIPPQNYYYGYYRVDSGELYTYKVDPNASATIYDIEQEYGAGEDRLYTFKTWRDFAAAVQENEGLLVQPYTLTLKNGVVVKIEEKFYQ